MKGRLGSYVGTLVGFLGWVIGLSVIGLAAGKPQLVFDHLLPGITISLGLGLSCLMVMECLLQLYGRRDMALFQMALWGMLSTSVGLLLMLLNYWLLPRLTEDPDTLAQLRRTGSVTQIGDAVPTGLMLLGAGLLALSLRRLLRNADTRQDTTRESEPPS